MPKIETTPRQEPTGLTTRTPYLVVVGPPLNTKPPTTQFLHSFSPSIQQILQYFLKTTNSMPFNSNKTDRQFLTFRPYVPNLQYN